MFMDFHGLEDSILVDSVLSKLINRFNAIPVKISKDFSVQNDNLILKFI